MKKVGKLVSWNVVMKKIRIKIVTRKNIDRLNEYIEMLMKSWQLIGPSSTILIRRNHLPSIFFCSVGWGCRIHRLLLCRGVRPPPNECPGYDTKQSDGELPAVLELWGMRRTPSLPSLPGPLWPGVVAPDRALSMG